MNYGNGSRVESLPQLALSFQDGDLEALREVVDQYGIRLKAFCRVVTGSAEIAEEVVQEVFLRAWEHRESLRDPGKLEAWLFTLARNRALRTVQKSSHQRESAWEPENIASLGLAANEPGARENLLGEQSAALIQEALRTLDPKKRDLLSLRYFSGLSFAEIAEVLDMPMGSIGTTISRALTQMRKHFEEIGLAKEDLIP